ncbi:hypothetical protein SeLEV6574_g04530 [Synchytrium endobioticum]|uniref:Homeobox domain-containing protein n=1 Tax=Synchytrium endobioticum TaxID=286115 RepID=A0A507CZ95_9FUNG|nr:hypothetical protein SeLEV6574_g04530 [Synchytrium endobioticum]
MSKSKGVIFHYSDADKAYLEQKFKENPIPSVEECAAFAKDLGKHKFPDAGPKVHKWFTRRRAREKDERNPYQHIVGSSDRSDSSDDLRDARKPREDSLISVGSSSESDDDSLVPETETTDAIKNLERRFSEIGLRSSDGDQLYRDIRRYIRTWRTVAGRKVLVNLINKTVDDDIVLKFGEDERFLSAIRDFLTSLMKDLMTNLTPQTDKSLYILLAGQVLHFLERLPIPSDMVVSSKIGVFVNNKMFKETSSIDSINQVARDLLTKWKNERAKDEKKKKTSNASALPALSSVADVKQSTLDDVDKKRPAASSSMPAMPIKRPKLDAELVSNGKPTSAPASGSMGASGNSSIEPPAHKPGEAAKAALKKLRLSGIQAPVKRMDGMVPSRGSHTEANSILKSSSFDLMAKDRAEKTAPTILQRRPPTSSTTAANPTGSFGERHDGTIIPPKPEGMTRKEWLKRHKIRIYFPAQDSLLRKIKTFEKEDDGEEHKHHASLREAEIGEYVKGKPIEDDEESAEYIVKAYQTGQNSVRVHSQERTNQERRIQGILMTTYYTKSDIPPSPKECVEQLSEMPPLWERAIPADISLPLTSPSNELSSLCLAPVSELHQAPLMQPLQPNSFPSSRPIMQLVPTNNNSYPMPPLTSNANSIASTFKSSNNTLSFPIHTNSQTSVAPFSFRNPLFNPPTPPPASTSFPFSMSSRAAALPSTTTDTVSAVAPPLSLTAQAPVAVGTTTASGTFQEGGHVKLESLLSVGGGELKSLLSNLPFLSNVTQTSQAPSFNYLAGQPSTPPPPLTPMTFGAGSTTGNNVAGANSNQSSFGLPPTQPSSSGFAGLPHKPFLSGSNRVPLGNVNSLKSASSNPMLPFNMPPLNLPQHPIAPMSQPSSNSSFNAFGGPSQMNSNHFGIGGAFAVNNNSGRGDVDMDLEMIKGIDRIPIPGKLHHLAEDGLTIAKITANEQLEGEIFLVTSGADPGGAEGPRIVNIHILIKRLVTYRHLVVSRSNRILKKLIGRGVFV